MKRLVFGTLSLLMLASAYAPAISAGELSSVRHSETRVQLAQNTNLIASGTFVTTEQDHPTKGTARIVLENNRRVLVFDSGFTTAEGPDVQVVLYRGTSVPVNLEASRYVTLAALQSFEGTQRYVLPNDLDLDDFSAVAIWCRAFNVTFGYATLIE
ncbi:Electron transfer DM13 [Rubidibacter lacunae KORDI 51-2]|uniref:Electron transfer DM13 n=1 Tax=Rubidibacter lacunae KORDI 51-2 TaxID=582515 RepID=U5DKB7_9CHRO|nr:DM13 domain-containing protein [Rubidibacter lacunae]ERN42106.1 Electron transfer DM13 [Rubidibacter lacunae KORDI 51-2]